ncbi:MAG: hypothetical protein ABEJ97_05100 [Halobellus sp.]
MTDRIDIDDLDVETDEEEDETESDWLAGDDAGGWETPVERDDERGRDESERGDGGGESERSAADRDARAVPHVPKRNDDRPAGIPVESGGAGAGATADEGGTEAAHSAESGPHGGGADDLTLALTYGAMKRLEDPRLVCADANQWADWLGVVGDVPAHVLTNFQREHGLDLDFFNGGGKGPAERLADIDEHSMFYADRMLLIGVDEDDAAIAERAGWEYLDLDEAAEKADWTLAE